MSGGDLTTKTGTWPLRRCPLCPGRDTWGVGVSFFVRWSVCQSTRTVFRDLYSYCSFNVRVLDRLIRTRSSKKVSGLHTSRESKGKTREEGGDLLGSGTGCVRGTWTPRAWSRGFRRRDVDDGFVGTGDYGGPRIKTCNSPLTRPRGEFFRFFPL